MEKKQEIIFVYNAYSLGGVQRQASLLSNSFAEQGYDVSIVAIHGRTDESLPVTYYAVNPQVHMIMLPEYYSEHQNIILRTKAQLKVIKLKILRRLSFQNHAGAMDCTYKITIARQIQALSLFLSKHKQAIIVALGFKIFELTYFAALENQCRIIYASMTAETHYIQDERNRRVLELIRKTDACVFQTEQVRSLYHVSDEKAYVIRNPINHNLIAPYDGKRRNAVVTFCRISREKNLMLLLKAFHKVQNQFPDYRLEIYGDSETTNQQVKAELLEYIDQNELNSKVSIYPSHPDVHDIVKDAAVFVSSSDHEGLSNSMIEAMAIGLPCVCTDCDGGGAREIIQDGVNGLLVPVNDEEKLYMAIVRLIEDTDLRNYCSRNAVDIRSALSIENITGQWLNVFDRIK